MAWDWGLGIGGLYSGLILAGKCLHTSSYQAFFWPTCLAIFQLRKLFAYLGSAVYANRARYGEGKKTFPYAISDASFLPPKTISRPRLGKIYFFFFFKMKDKGKRVEP